MSISVFPKVVSESKQLQPEFEHGMLILFSILITIMWHYTATETLNLTMENCGQWKDACLNGTEKIVQLYFKRVRTLSE